jgi:hypothetical protein
MSITGNDERDRMIYAAMKAAANADEILSLDNVKAKLPGDFDLLPGELVACRHAAKLDSLAPLEEIKPARALMISENPDGHSLAPEPVHDVARDAVNEQPEQVETAPNADAFLLQPEARLTQAQARAAVESAAKRLDLARLAVRMTRAALNEQRGKLSVAIEAWQNGGPKWTDAMEREHMRASYLATKGSGPRMNTRKFPAQDMRSGVKGFKGNRRNGLPSEMQHQNVATPGMFQGGMAKKV